MALVKKGGGVIGRSRGGRITKIHAVVYRLERKIRFNLTAGQMGDCPAAPGLIEALPKAEPLLACAAYDSNALRQLSLNRGTKPVIKPNPTRRHIPPFDEQLTKQRNRIERAILTDFGAPFYV